MLRSLPIIVLLTLGVGGCATAPRPSLARLATQAATHCEGVSSEQSIATLLNAGATVTRLERDVPVTTKVSHRRTVGVSLYVAARPGVTPELLQRAARCDLARSELAVARGQDHHPVVPPGATVKVTPTEHGYVVEIHAAEASHIEPMLASLSSRTALQ